MSHSRNGAIDAFDLQPGRIIAGKYEVLAQLGVGWEGEVYKVCERATGVPRAAKIFFPHRNIRDKAAKFYAKKLHKLRDCPIVIQYHSQEKFRFHGHDITFLMSEYVEGELLSKFLARQPGKRVSAFQGLHLLHALAIGLEGIHDMREYHGDLHTDNVIIRRYGISFDLRVLDMFHWGSARAENIHDDVCDLLRIFYDAIGGQRHYSKQPKELKAICCGLKRSLILKKFRSAGQLRKYLETMEWR
ncbi:MAG TPA: serine/threonine protein kinase [Pirellulales bacterium]|nr:serine/threonine protein kinase [Pirellulales bacterium]